MADMGKTEKLIIGPILKFSKRLNVQYLNMKFGKHLHKFMALKTSKN